uniref:Ig-like domain-containing protein n=1 Tax=Amphilophus citrinellus TaxID=61819 RepID=A0A3Q0SQ88_AMPCI
MQHLRLMGASVVINCDYDYPFGHIVTSVAWSKLLHVSGRWRSRKSMHLSVRGNDSLKENLSFYNFSKHSCVHISSSELTTIVQPSTVTEGDHVRLTCMSGCPEPTNIFWFRDGQPVTSPAFQARREDAGRYYCAVQGQEIVRSAPVALNVQYAPRDVTLSVSPSGDIISGGTVTFTCGSDANPPAHFSWYKSTSMSVKHTGQVWNITEVTSDVSGSYYCQIQTGDKVQISTMLPVSVNSINFIKREVIYHCSDSGFIFTFVLFRRRKSARRQSYVLTETAAKP